jgi:hypothetical protein
MFGICSPRRRWIGRADYDAPEDEEKAGFGKGRKKMNLNF